MLARHGICIYLRIFWVKETQFSLNIPSYLLFSLLDVTSVTSDYVIMYCYIICTVDILCSCATFHHYALLYYLYCSSSLFLYNFPPLCIVILFVLLIFFVPVQLSTIMYCYIVCIVDLLCSFTTCHHYVLLYYLYC